MSSIPFAGLAPDARLLRGAGDLTAFDVRDACNVGRDLLRLPGSGAPARDVAVRLLDSLNAYEHDSRPAFVLLRVFVTRPAAAGEASHLELVGTRGLEPAWNDVASSTSHRTLSLEGDRTPMVAELVRQLRIGDDSAPAATTFLVDDARASVAVPAKGFVQSYDVRSVVGFAVTPWPGESVVVVCFTRAAMAAASGIPFSALALYLKLAWLESREGAAAMSAAERETARATVLDELVAAHERHLRDLLAEWPRRLELARLDAAARADAKESERAAQNEKLRRTQAAMLNLVEDLREARIALESKVAQRTTDLAAKGAQLEARNQELEEFVYIASHDLQEPLRTVSGYLQMIQRRYGAKLGVEADEFITFAVEGAQRMQALIESLLLYSRVATKEHAREEVPLDQALDLALRNLALRIEETRAIIDREPLPTVVADRTQLVQLFQNLVGNAIKFAGDEPPRVRVSATRAGGFFAIAVRDEGIGFNPKFVDRIFKVFRRLRRDTPGTGIGLAVCKKIAERLGGHIEAESIPGSGSTFTVHLPVTAHD